jgi:PAS domain S-box-containing protein
MKFVNEILDEPVQHQLLKRLSTILIPLGFLGSLISLTGSLFGEQSTHQLMVSLCVLCLFSVSLFFLRRQEIKKAVLMIILGMWLIFSVMTLQGTGVMGPDYPSLIFPIVAVSTVSSSSGLLIASYLSFVLVGALSFLPPFELYSAGVPLPTPARVWGLYVVHGLGITFMLHLAQRAYGEVVKKIAKRESLLSSIFSSISDPLLVLNGEGEVAHMNQSARELEGWLQQESLDLMSAPLLDIHTNQPMRLSDLTAQKSCEERRHQVRLQLAHQTVWYFVTCSPQRLNGEVLGTVISLRDVTDQHQLMQTQKLNAVGVLADGIAHDFNNMLGAIRNATELLEFELEDLCTDEERAEETSELIQMIKEASLRSGELVTRLRQFSKIKPTQKSTISLSELAYEVHQQLITLAPQQQTHLDVDESVEIKGDASQLRVALLNLGLNALQAVRESGGAIWMSVRRAELDEEACQHSPLRLSPGAFACVEVRDEGVGIDPRVRDRIFEPFFTTRGVGEGTGLGLSTVHGAVTSHGGAVEVISAPGEGALFKLYFPLKEATLSSPPREELTRGAQVEVKRALVIDDEPLIRRSLKGLLSALSVEATLAESGDQGLNALREGLEVDVVILDMQMPEKSGREVFYELKALFPLTPVILSSGFSPEGVLEELLAEGLVGLLPKPYHLDELKELLARVRVKRS